MPPEAPHVIATAVIAVMQFVKRYLPSKPWTPIVVNALAFLFCLGGAFVYAVTNGVDPITNIVAVVQTAVQAWFEAVGGYEFGKNVLSRGLRVL